MTGRQARQESVNVPLGQIIWQCPSCARRYYTEQPPVQCPFCLRPVKR
jgi:rubrerythrin